MEIVGGGLLALVLLAVFASQLLVFPAMWRGFRGGWRRYSAEGRRRGIVGGVLAGVYMVVLGGLVIAEPLGHYTIVYVMGFGLGAAVVLALVAVAVQTVQARRRARRLRAHRSEPGKRNQRDVSGEGGER